MAEARKLTDSHGRYNLEEDKKALLEGINQVLNASIEKEKEINDFLHGVPAIVQAIASKQIQCKVYTKEKFHAQAYYELLAENY